MGGVAILTGIWAGYLGSHLIGLGMDNAEGPSASGLLVLGLTTALGGVGFLDDFIKIRKQRNLGLNKTAKLVGQFVAAIAFGILALQFRGDDGLTPGSVHLSYVRDIATVSLGSVVFIAFCYLLVSAWSNAVNLTDGLDGLAAGAMSFVLGAYVIITFWQFRYSCETNPGKGCYDVRDPLDLAVLCAAGAGACIGFPLVECRTRQDLHGRHRFSCPRRHARRIVDHHQHGTVDGGHRCTVRRGGRVGGDPGSGVPVQPTAGLPNGAVPSPLRTRRVG